MATKPKARSPRSAGWLLHGAGCWGEALQLSPSSGSGVLRHGDPQTPTEQAANGAAAQPEAWSGERDGGFTGKAASAGGGQLAGGLAEWCEPGGVSCADVPALPPTALCEGEDACGADEVCVRPGVCFCKPGFFGADCSSREYFPRAQPLPSPLPAWVLRGLPGFPITPILAVSFPSQAAPSSTGAPTASGAAHATPTGAATRRAGAAPATPTTGESSASSLASAAPTAAATPSLAPAAASRAGGHPPARSNVSATPPAPTATLSPATAAACRAGGAGGAVSNAPATSRPAPRRRASANARLGFGGRRASGAATACTAPAAPSAGTAAAAPATRAGAAGTPVRQGNTGLSVCTGEPGAAGVSCGYPGAAVSPWGGKSSQSCLSLWLGRETHSGGV